MTARAVLTNEMEIFKKIVVGIFFPAFLGVMLCGIGTIVYFFSIWDAAAQVSDATHFIPLTNHGKTVYITVAQNYWYTLLFRTAFIGGGALFVAAFIFEAFGISVFPETKIEDLPPELQKFLDLARFQKSSD